MTLFYTKKHQRFGSKSSHHPCLYVAHVQHVHPGMVGRKHADKDVRDKRGPTETTPCRRTLQEPLLTQSAAMANDKNTHTQV